MSEITMALEYKPDHIAESDGSTGPPSLKAVEAFLAECRTMGAPDNTPVVLGTKNDQPAMYLRWDRPLVFEKTCSYCDYHAWDHSAFARHMLTEHRKLD